METLKRLLVVVACSLPGCAQVSIFEPPTSGPTATLTIRTVANPVISQMPVVAYRGNEYLESKGYRIAILRPNGSGKEDSEVTIKVPANTEFRFSIRFQDEIALGRFSVCQTHTSFVPKEGQSYMALHRNSGFGCGVVVLHMIPGAKPVVEESAKRLKACIDKSVQPGKFDDNEGLCPPENFNFRDQT